MKRLVGREQGHSTRHRWGSRRRRRWGKHIPRVGNKRSTGKIKST